MALFNFATAGGGDDSASKSCPLVRGCDLDEVLASPFKQRVEKAGALTAVNGLYPGSVYSYHAVRLAIYMILLLLVFLLSWRVFAEDVAVNNSQETVAEHVLLTQCFPNVFVRFTALTTLLEICGFCGMTGPLGAGQATFAPLWYRLSTRTLKQPLLRGLPHQRSKLDIGLFVMYVISNLSIICSPVDVYKHPAQVQLAVLLLTALCILDRSAYTGSLGAYYYPLLMCEAFGREIGMLGCQLVQFAHLFMAGVGKLGPWFQHVTPSMVGVCPWIPLPLKRCLFCRSPDGSLDLLKPSPISNFMSYLGISLELVCPILMVSSARVLRLAGVCLAVALHLYVVLMFAPGAVGEWNLFNILAIIYLFGFHEGLMFEQFAVASPLLLMFIFSTVYLAPLVGNCWPTALSNHFTLRKYTGNHPYHTFLMKRSAASKLAHIRTYMPLAVAKPVPQVELVMCGALHSLVRGRLNLRRVLDLFALVTCQDSTSCTLDDFVRVDLGFLMSQTMLDITFLDDTLLKVLKDAGFQAGELFSLRVTSFPTFTLWPHRAPWELYDVGAGCMVAAGLVGADGSLIR